MKINSLMFSFTMMFCFKNFSVISRFCLLQKNTKTLTGELKEFQETNISGACQLGKHFGVKFFLHAAC